MEQLLIMHIWIVILWIPSPENSCYELSSTTLVLDFIPTSMKPWTWQVWGDKGLSVSMWVQLSFGAGCESMSPCPHPGPPNEQLSDTSFGLKSDRMLLFSGPVSPYPSPRDPRPHHQETCYHVNTVAKTQKMSMFWFKIDPKWESSKGQQNLAREIILFLLLYTDFLIK